MSKSPGHRKWPDHRVDEQRLEHRIQVAVNGELVADSNDVIRVEEDGSPVRYYFPRWDVKMDMLEPTDTTTECPFKGMAHYFALNVNGESLRDVVWTYEEPYEEHDALRDRVAFWHEKIDGIDIREVI
jgi:uncharacterized protein (DUF427 family)